jgi:hypothetical protein
MAFNITSAARSSRPKKHVMLQKISVLAADENFRLLAKTVHGAPGFVRIMTVH